MSGSGDCKERSKVAIGGIRFDGQVLINDSPKGLLLMIRSCAETGEVLVSIRDAYAYGSKAIQLVRASSMLRLGLLG